MNDTIKSANFDSIVSHDPVTGLPVYDRPLRGEDVREMYKMIVSDGIYPNPSTSFQVMEGENDNEVIVKAGFGWVQGCPVWDLSDDVVELDPADTNNPRIDLVVLQWNNLLANRWVQKVVITGTASATPSAPALTRTADIYEICLAEIERPAGSSLVIQSEITDTRGDDGLCGWTHGVVDQVDTSTIFNQYASWLSQIEAEWNAWWETQQETTGYLTTGGDYTTLKTFDKKVIHAINEVNDGSIALGRAHSGDGILSGCEMAISGSTLVIQPGEIIAGGKPVIFTSAVTVDLSEVSISDGYAQVILNIKASLNPAFWFTIAESSTTTFPDLTRDNLLVLGSLYQMQIAIIQISGGNISGIDESLLVSNIMGYRNINLIAERNGQVLIYSGTSDSNRIPQAVFGSVDDSYAYIGKRDADGVSITGLRLYAASNNNGIILFANGKYIVFRPNGASEDSGQMYLDMDGQLTGGHPRYSATNSSTNGMPANQIVSIVNLTVPKGGIYLVYANADFNPSSSGTGSVQYGLGFAQQSRSYIQSLYMNGGVHIYAEMAVMMNLSANDTIYFNLSVPVNGQISSRVIQAVKIN